MPKIYSIDLREKITKCYESKEYSFKAMAKIFNVSESTITRIIVRFKKLGEHKVFTETLGRKKVINEKGEKTIRKILDKNPDMTLHELQNYYEQKHKIRPGIGTLFYQLKRMGYKYKKKVNLQSNN